ncbi:MAG: hypothetical protein QW432_05590 [Desulfurococcaceae archaeon]
MAKLVEFDKVKDLENFIRKLGEAGYVVERGPHAVLEDHSEITTLKVYMNGRMVAYVVAHYITQYYRAVVSESYSNDQAFLSKLFEIKYSGERWSIPVNPVYIIVFEEGLMSTLEKYEDLYPVQDGEGLVEAYRSKNPNYKVIPRIVVARLVNLS